jgi:hypothetical protein
VLADAGLATGAGWGWRSGRVGLHAPVSAPRPPRSAARAAFPNPAGAADWQRAPIGPLLGR